MTKKSLYTVFLISTFSFSSQSFAGYDAIGGARYFTSNDIIIPLDMPDNTLLATYSIPSSLTYRYDNVSMRGGTDSGGRPYGTYVKTINGKKIFKTNIEGIGYAFGVGFESAQPSFGIRNDGTIITTWHPQYFAEISQNFVVELYKYGPSNSGRVNTTKVGASVVHYDAVSQWAPENEIFLNGFNVKSIRTCNLAPSGSTNIKFKDQVTNNFSKPTLIDNQLSSLTVNCPYTGKVSLTLTAGNKLVSGSNTGMELMPASNKQADLPYVVTSVEPATDTICQKNAPKAIQYAKNGLVMNNNTSQYTQKFSFNLCANGTIKPDTYKGNIDAAIIIE